MSGKVKRMSTIKQLIQLHLSGVSNRQIAKQLGIYKNTVNKYIQTLRLDPLSCQDLLTLDDPVLERRLYTGSPAYYQDRFDDLKTLLPYIESELKRKHVTRHLLWQEYRQSRFDGYSYSQFCYHLSQLESARKPTAILTHNPAEKLFIDFAGDTLCYVDKSSGEIVSVQVFVACLPFSDYTYVQAVMDQRTESFIHALGCCLQELGGSPKILVPDNLKAAVIKADKYEPDINQVLEDFANHYGCVVTPARVRKPKDKALVESSVNRIYQRVYAKLRHQTFFSLEELNKALKEKTREHNQTRMQQKSYSREEQFLAEEKALLRALPAHAFEIRYYTELKIAQNNCIYLGRDKHYYSVPFQYIGKQAKVIYTRTLVKVYVKGELVATHPRSYKFGYTTQKEHLCSAHNHYLDRSPEYYLRIAENRSEALYRLIQLIFDSQEVPEILYKRCDGLLSLQRKSDPVIFDRACHIATENHITSYKFVRNLMDKRDLINEQEVAGGTLPKHHNIRGKHYYQ